MEVNHTYKYSKGAVSVHDRNMIPVHRGMKLTFPVSDCCHRMPRFQHFVDWTRTNSMPTCFKYDLTGGNELHRSDSEEACNTKSHKSLGEDNLSQDCMTRSVPEVSMSFPASDCCRRIPRITPDVDWTRTNTLPSVLKHNPAKDRYLRDPHLLACGDSAICNDSGEDKRNQDRVSRSVPDVSMTFPANDCCRRIPRLTPDIDWTRTNTLPSVLKHNAAKDWYLRGTHLLASGDSAICSDTKSVRPSDDTLRSSQEHVAQGCLRASQESLHSIRESLCHTHTSLAKSKAFADDKESSIGYMSSDPSLTRVSSYSRRLSRSSSLSSVDTGSYSSGELADIETYSISYQSLKSSVTSVACSDSFWTRGLSEGEILPLLSEVSVSSVRDAADDDASSVLIGVYADSSSEVIYSHTDVIADSPMPAPISYSFLVDKTHAKPSEKTTKSETTGQTAVKPKKGLFTRLLRSIRYGRAL